jgi:thiamine pyrophosphokinase
VPLHGPALGVTTSGLLYTLDHEDLHPGSTRGVSNELTRSPGRVSIEHGVLVAIQPGSLGTHHEEHLR